MRSRWLASVLASTLFVGAGVVLHVVLIGDERERAECVSRGGVPTSSECWIDGKPR